MFILPHTLSESGSLAVKSPMHCYLSLGELAFRGVLQSLFHPNCSYFGISSRQLSNSHFNRGLLEDMGNELSTLGEGLNSAQAAKLVELRELVEGKQDEFFNMLETNAPGEEQLPRVRCACEGRGCYYNWVDNDSIKDWEVMYRILRYIVVPNEVRSQDEKLRAALTMCLIQIRVVTPAFGMLRKMTRGRYRTTYHSHARVHL